MVRGRPARSAPLPRPPAASPPTRRPPSPPLPALYVRSPTPQARRQLRASGGSSTLVVHLATKAVLGSYTLKTANDVPSRDPSAWSPTSSTATARRHSALERR